MKFGPGVTKVYYDENTNSRFLCYINVKQCPFCSENIKQEAIKYIKQGYIHKKINLYLKKAIDNETKYKVEQKNQKMSSKYLVLTELYKK